MFASHECNGRLAVDLWSVLFGSKQFSINPTHETAPAMESSDPIRCDSKADTRGERKES